MANTWTKEQQLAIDLRGRRILVSAAAGSGKTAVLTERIAQRLCDMDDPVDADQLLVMTFTRAAAAEMKERIRKRLEQMQTEPGLSNEQITRLREQTTLLDNAYVMTIDSFCSRVVHDHPDEAEIDPSFRVLEAIEMKLIRQDVMEAMLEEYYEAADPDFLNFVESYTKVKSSDKLDEMIIKVYEAAQDAVEPDKWYEAQLSDDTERYRAYMLEQAKVMLEAALNQADEALEICMDFEGPIKSEAAVRTDIDTIESALDAQDFDELRHRLSCIAFPSLSSAKKGVDIEKKDKLTALRNGYKTMLKSDLIKPLCDELPDDYEEMEAKSRGAIAVLVKLAQDFDARYTAKKREKNVMEFSDIAHTALRLLQMEDIQEEYREKFREIYIDEYQDSSDIQEELKNAIDTGEVFMVGDVKQSIYGFRNARPALFMEKYDGFAAADHDGTAGNHGGKTNGADDIFEESKIGNGPGCASDADPQKTSETCESQNNTDIRIDLSANFRSRAGVLDGINRIFRKIMMRELGGVQYTPEVELNPKAVFPQAEGGVRTGGRNQLLIMLEEAGADAGDTVRSSKEADRGNVKSSKEATSSTVKGAVKGESAGDSSAGAESSGRSGDSSGQDGADEDKEVLEARMIAQKIASLMSGPESIQVREGDGYRPLKYSDIAILCRSGANSETYQQVLMDSGIPAYLDSKKGYFDTLEIRTMLAVLSAVNNPLRDIELTAWLCSPMIGMTQEELARLMAVYKRRRRKNTLRCVKRALELAGELLPDKPARRKNGRKVSDEPASEDGEAPACTDMDIFAKADEDVKAAEAAEYQAVHEDKLMTASIRQKAAFALERLADYDEKSRSMPISELIAYICGDTGYYDYVSALPGGSVRRANLERLMEIARSYAKTGYQGLFNFVRYVEAVKTYNEDMGEANVLGEHDDIVRIMTIHKSKGMEFPVCILAGTGKTLNLQSSENVLIDHDLGIGCAYVDTDLHVRYKTLKQQVVHYKMRSEELGEELRILYVALTRAKEQLIITGTRRDDEKKLKERMGAEGLPGVRSAKKYLDWLLMDPEGFDLDVQVYRPSDLSGDRAEEARTQAVDEWISHLTITPEARDEYDRIFDFKYPHQADTTLHNKISISELKRLGQREDEEKTYFPEYTAGEMNKADVGEDVEHVASCAANVGEAVKTDTWGANEESETVSVDGQSVSDDACCAQSREDNKSKESRKSAVSGSQRGTIYHRVFEKLDFSKVTDAASAKAYLDELLPDLSERRAVRYKDVLNWIESDIGKLAAEADSQGRFYREHEFIMGLPARQLGVADSDEPVLIQGIIDAYIEQENEIILIDYKTDRVKTEEELRQRYAVQLKYYAIALEKMKHKPVNRRVIWSVQLAKAVELK